MAGLRALPGQSSKDSKLEIGRSDCSRSGEGGDSGVAFLDSSVDAQTGVKNSRLFPQHSRLFPAKDRKTANSVRQIQRRFVSVAPIQSERLVITRLRQIGASLFKVDVSQMPDGVRQDQGLVRLSEQNHGLL